MKAVIFDMDGLLIDSEPMWKSAERHVFSLLGVEVSDELSSLTAVMTTREVTEFWFHHFPWQNRDLNLVEQDVIDMVGSLIKAHGVAKKGVLQTLELFRQHHCKIGLATNAPQTLIPLVLGKLGISEYFDCTVSSSEVKNGKPHPDVYLAALAKLNVTAVDALAFEDSISGLKAATAAKIRTIVVPGVEQLQSKHFHKAKYKLANLGEFNTELLSELCHVQ
jgi:sugar-phosphatase